MARNRACKSRESIANEYSGITEQEKSTVGKEPINRLMQCMSVGREPEASTSFDASSFLIGAEMARKGEFAV